MFGKFCKFEGRFVVDAPLFGFITAPGAIIARNFATSIVCAIARSVRTPTTMPGRF